MIEQIKVKVGDKEIDLTLEEALALKNDLNSILGVPLILYWPMMPSPQAPEPFIYQPVITWTTVGGTSEAPM